MPTFIKLLACLLMLSMSYSTNAQKKGKHTNRIIAKKSSVKFTERGYGAPTSVSQITDIDEKSSAFESVKSLIENYNVAITYDDNSFRGNEILRRGDFIVSLNSAFNGVKKAATAAELDTSLINTYDKNRSYLTSVKDVKDLKEGSVYYNATQSLLERWGVAAPFTKAKALNAGSIVTEAEVYDILKVTLGYASPGVNPFNAGISRAKFATVLHNAISQKISVINTLHSTQEAARDTERRRMQDSINISDNIRKQAIAMEIEAKRMEAQKREDEARKKLKEKQK